MICSNCRQEGGNGDYCEMCGAKMVPVETKFCPHCLQLAEKDSRFCPHCGYDFYTQDPPQSYGEPTVRPQPKKSRAWIYVLCAAAAALLLGEFIFVLIHFSSDITKKTVDTTYITVDRTVVAAKPFTETGSSEELPGKALEIVEIQENAEGEIWIRDTRQRWLKAQDSSTVYMVEEDTSLEGVEDVNDFYTIVKRVSIYGSPAAISNPLGFLDPEVMQEVKVYQTKTLRDGTVWARIGNYEWVIAEEGGNANLERKKGN